MVNFKQLLEKATSSDLSEPDWETILEIVEEVKGKNTSPKNAVKEFRKRLLDNNGNTVYHTLLVLDSVVKNCSSDVHNEVLTQEFMQIMKTVITTPSSGEKAVDKALEMIGEWKAAFGQQSGYKAVNDMFSELQRQGYHIPEAEVASAAFLKKAPEWVLGDRCYICRNEFHRFKGAFRHHCRNCGKSVCATCSSKRLALPHYGIEQPTRVCDICYKKQDKPGALESAAESSSSDLPPEYLQSSLAQESQQPSSTSAPDSELQMREEDDLQLAIAMSLNEQENKSKAKKSSPAVRAPSPAPMPRSTTPSAPPPSSNTLYATIMHDPAPSQSSGPTAVSYSIPAEPESDPNLARYLDRGYWEQRREQQTSGPGQAVGPGGGARGVATAGRKSPATAARAAELGPEAVVLTQQGSSGSPLAETVRKTVEMFLQRMHEVNNTGRSIATDPVILSLYQNLNALQPQLLQQIDEVQQKKAKQEAILQKLNEAKEARVTLNRMRREHQEKVQQQEKEQALLARMQMEQKLALLRQQKQEQLDFEKSLQQQRLDTLQSQRSEYEQKLHAQREKERQMLIAQEQQILHQQFGSNGATAQPAVPVVVSQPAGMVGGAHQYMAPPPTSTYNPTSLQFQSLSLHDPTQAGPLPQKLDHTLGLDQPAPPPPYHPPAFQQPAPQPLSVPGESMASSFNPYQPPGPSSYQPPVSSTYQLQFAPQQQQPGGVGGGGLVPSATPLPPSSFSTAASLHPPQMNGGQPHSLESVLSVPPGVGGGMGGAGGQPSSLPPQLEAAPPQQYHQPAFIPAAPAQPISGGVSPQPSALAYQQQPATYPGPGQPTGIPPPGVSYQAPPTAQQFGGAPMQMHAPGGFIPNGAQAPPQPHPPPMRQESQPPLISFD